MSIPSFRHLDNIYYYEYPRIVNKILVGVISLVLVGAVIYVLYTNKVQLQNPLKTSSPQPVETSQPATSGGTLEGGNAIMVDEQEAGEIAYINLAVLDEPGFVVVYDVGNDGKQADLVGHSDYLEKGQKENVPVEIDPAMEVGVSYIAVLHGDDGDQDFGSEVEDKVLKDEDGKEVSMKFTVKKASQPAALE